MYVSHNIMFISLFIKKMLFFIKHQFSFCVLSVSSFISLFYDLIIFSINIRFSFFSFIHPSKLGWFFFCTLKCKRSKIYGNSILRHSRVTSLQRISGKNRTNYCPTRIITTTLLNSHYLHLQFNTFAYPKRSLQKKLRKGTTRIQSNSSSEWRRK